ncbi:MAG: tRNA lysidine(34) synthetase TilS [Candidatus Rokuibacteriota bacterium]|nr:MAG: tRNA lysidine(34) synthetase TilS [Candidatus Rokubacteria bacterium]
MALRALVERTIRRHAMLAGGETVLVGVSGGADSVALLHLLIALVPSWRLRLHVLHVDHELRPDSARDGDFVRALGARLGVPVDVATVTVDRRASLEAAARTARHAALEAWAARVGAQRIALGHTADDQAETVLMRLLQGAGVRGLAGIPPVRGQIIRPLIEVRRAALEAELRRADLSWVEDPTNRDPKFLRNRIRHELLPLLADSYNPEVATALARVATLARDTVSTLDRAASAELDRLGVLGDQTVTLPLARLRSLARQTAAEVLRQGAGRLGSRAPLRAWAHRGLRRVLATPAPRRPFKLGGITIEVSCGLVRLALASPPRLPERAVAVPGRTELPEIGLALEARVVAAGEYAVPRESSRVAFDADELAGPLVVRARRTGERLVSFGGGERRLKTLLIDAKVPRWERGRIPVVESGGEIVWVGNLRRGASARVTRRTRRVLELALVPLAKSERDRVE